MSWFDEVYPQLPPDLPDAAYDAAREQYWATRVRPEALRGGASLTSAREEFMKATERPGKSSMPRAELAAASAAKALTAPLSALGPLTSPLAKGTKEWAMRAHEEATKQGAGTLGPEMVGQVAGELPYWIGGMSPVKALAGAAGKRLGGRAAVEAAAAAGPNAGASALAGSQAISKAVEQARRPIETILGSMIQGVYDAASADQGHRITAGLQGAALGGGATAATVYAGPLWRYLRKAHGLSAEEAQAVEAVARGGASPAQEAAAAQAAQKAPGLGVSLEDWMTDQIKAANKAGRPLKGLFSEPVGKIKVTITGADGKSYRVGGKGGVDVWQIDKIARLVGKQLDQGGVVDSVTGDPGAINALYLQFDHINAARGAYNAPAGLRPGVRGLLPAAQQEDQLWMRLLEAPKPQPAKPLKPPVRAKSAEAAAPLTESRVVADLEALVADPSIPEAQKRAARVRLSRVKPVTVEATPSDKPKPPSVETPRTEGPSLEAQAELQAKVKAKKRIDVDAHEPRLGRLETLPSGLVRDRLTGVEYKDQWDAYRAVRFARGGEKDYLNWLRKGVRERGGSLEGQLKTWTNMEHEVGVQTDFPDLTRDDFLRRGGVFWTREFGEWDLTLQLIDQPKALKEAGDALAQLDRGQQGKVLVEYMNPKDSILMDPLREQRLDWETLRGANYDLKRARAVRFQRGGSRLAEGAPPSYKETPQAHRVSAGQGPIKPLADAFFKKAGGSQIPSEFNPRGATYSQGPGQKPAIFIGEGAAPNTLFHESLHGNFAYLDLHRDLEEVVTSSMSKKLSQGFMGDLADNWARDSSVEAEEVFTYLSEFVRMNDQPNLAMMAEWDDGYANMLQWYAETSQKLLGRIASLPDSVHKRALERRLKFTQLRAAGDVQLINHGPHQLEGDVVDFINGRWWWYSQKNGTATAFDTKDQLLRTMEDLYAEPISAPNLVDESALPKGFPRFAVENAVRPPAGELRPPIHTEPPPTPRAKPGRKASFYFRPFGPWLSDLSGDLKMPELYSAFKPLENNYREMSHFTDRYAKVLNETIGKFRGAGRQDALYRYLEAKDKDLAALEFNLTPKEIESANRLRTEFFDPLFSEFGIPLERYLQDYAPHIRARALQGDTDINSLRRGLPKELDFFAEHLRTGDLDPRDTHLLRVAATYLRLGARKKFLSEASVEAGKFIDAHKAELGTTHFNQLKRHIEHVRGVPDASQALLDSAVDTVLDAYNATVAAANKVMPFSLEPLMTDIGAREALGRYMLYTYSAGLGLRPIAIIRDSTQTLTTSLPLLGPKYLAKGLKEAFSGNRAQARQLAAEYGAVLEHQHMASLYSGGYEFIEPTKLNEFAQNSLHWYEAVNNGGRIVTWAGHRAKALDAIRAFKGHQDIKRFMDESAIGWLDEPLAQQYAQEALTSNPGEWFDLAGRAAKDLTDVSHWNYTRGAHPGLYKYAVGRLFGQYGTWPLNYIEYARRLSTAKGVSGRERLRAFATLVAAHGAILSGLESQGIDASGWVLSSPAAYGGGPVFNALVQAPSAVFDWQTYRGDEARRSLKRTVWPMSVPGGQAFTEFYEFANEPNPSYLDLLGFKPLEKEVGVFKLTPTEPPED